MTHLRFGLVLGFPRSGGTVLRRVLDQHPDISCPPEPWLTTASARFLADMPTESVPLGVRTGVGFSGISEGEVTAALRDLIFGFHAKMAGGKPVWVEKSGFDVFHLRELADLFSGHAKFICMVRHPLDVIASNLDLARQMGRFPAEMQPYLARFAAPIEALAEAWADTTEALLDFAQEREDTVVYRFEDLLIAPVETLDRLYDLLGVARQSLDQIDAAVSAPARPGLGDWKTYAEPKLNPAPIGRWQKAMSRRVAGALMARLGPVMVRAGYDPVTVPRVPSRADAIKHYAVAARMATRADGKA